MESRKQAFIKSRGLNERLLSSLEIVGESLGPLFNEIMGLVESTRSL